MPPGVKVVTTYDRSDLIRESIATANENLIEELIVVSVLIVGFLLHLRSALIPILTLPLAVLISFIPMYVMGIGMNIMSIGGIIVAIGDMVDAAIIMVDNAHKRLEEWEREGRHGRQVRHPDCVGQAGRPGDFRLLAGDRHRLHAGLHPGGPGRAPVQAPGVHQEPGHCHKRGAGHHPDPGVAAPARARPHYRRAAPSGELAVAAPLRADPTSGPAPPLGGHPARARVALTVPLAFQRLGSEFMPPLYEGTILYMPTTLPGLSVTAAAQLLQKMDRTLKSFPEVARVFGKAGRAETSTDPAPFSMMEVVVQLKPKEQWRPGLTYEGLVAEMDKALQLPGVTNAWTMPIKARIDMLTTGVRTPVGIKIFGPDLKQIEEIGKHLEMVAQEVPGTRSVYAERVSGGYFLDFDIRRDEIARYGLTVMDVGQIIESAIGGESIATTIEGRERYPINVRYPRELRDTPEKLQSCPRHHTDRHAGAVGPAHHPAGLVWPGDDSGRKRHAVRLRVRGHDWTRHWRVR